MLEEKTRVGFPCRATTAQKTAQKTAKNLFLAPALREAIHDQPTTFPTGGAAGRSKLFQGV
jgi:hypothetical protein